MADQQQSYPEIKYSIYKNLGWARLQQTQYPESESALKTAVAISEQPDAAIYYYTRAIEIHPYKQAIQKNLAKAYVQCDDREINKQ